MITSLNFLSASNKMIVTVSKPYKRPRFDTLFGTDVALDASICPLLSISCMDIWFVMPVEGFMG